MLTILPPGSAARAAPLTAWSAGACDNGAVLPHDYAFTPLILGILLAALLGLLVFRAVRKDRREYQQFKNFTETADRQRMLRRWLSESLLLFGGSTVVILAFAWQFIPHMLAEVYAYSWVQSLRQLFAAGGDYAIGITWGIALAIAIGTVLVVLLARHTDEVPTIGDVAALLPRNRPELLLGTALSINAGIVEELLFRLALPTLIYGVVSNAAVAIVASVLLFGLLHIYQRVWGVIGSTLVGCILMALYVATGNILVPIVAHALFDLRSLVLIPMVVYKVHRRPE
jgi:membrane protease YdiL (CAAX protease family)